MTPDMNTDTLANIKNSIVAIPDYPHPGIIFRDITSLIQDNIAFNQTIECLVLQFKNKGYTKVLGTEARGFIFGSVLAHRLNIGFIPARKPNKLPRDTISQAYELEYGTDELHIHEDALSCHDSVLVVDDLIATGGTIEAAIKLIRQLGAKVNDAAFVISLPDLGGEDKIKALGVTPFSLIEFEGE